MEVYRSHRASVVHFDVECPRATGNLVALDITELKAARFCKTCTPERLHTRPVTRHQVCKVCRQRKPMPCAHNGGVAVVNVDVMVHYGREVRRVNTRWRWSENVLGAVTEPRLARPGPAD